MAEDIFPAPMIPSLYLSIILFDLILRLLYNSKVTYIGEWLNGRAAVSKTAGCVFESRLPCQVCLAIARLFLLSTRFSTQQASSSESALHVTFTNWVQAPSFTIPSFLSSRTRLPCQVCLASARLFLLSTRFSTQQAFSSESALHVTFTNWVQAYCMTRRSAECAYCKTHSAARFSFILRILRFSARGLR